MLAIDGQVERIDLSRGISSLLDRTLEYINIKDRKSLDASLLEIGKFRLLMDSEEEVKSAQSIVQSHRLFSVLLEDPYTHHAYSKPREFAGDASMIDLLYGYRSGSEADTESGRFIFETLMRFPSCDAVRFRRSYYGAFIDEIAGKREGAQVLALACGHLREALFSRAVTNGSVQLTGMDSDPLAVAEAQRSLSSKGVNVRNESVIDFIRRRAWGETYDGIYAAGLFDYLDLRVGQKVVSTAFEALRPGGTLSVANFLPGIIEQGYMDLVMDWRLIYRSPDDMRALASELPPEQADVTVSTDPMDTVAYLTVTKRG